MPNLREPDLQNTKMLPSKSIGPAMAKKPSDRGPSYANGDIKSRPKSKILQLTSEARSTKLNPSRTPFSRAKWERLKVKKPPEPRHVHWKPKRYRHSIRLRLRARLMLFLGALTTLVLERYFGILFQLDDFMDVYYQQMGIDPWQVETPPWKLVAPVYPIHNLTNSHPEPCPEGLRRMINVHNPKFHNQKRIPMIVHQTYSTRCLTNNFERAARDWVFPHWSYYLHDDEAVDRLLAIDFPEFPQLRLVVDSCVLSPRARIFLWQYLVLWMYGGIYVDLNLYPVRFNTTTIGNMDDGFFFTEVESQKLSTRLMAATPRHPLIYYAIEKGLTDILRAKDVGSLDPNLVFGDSTLHQALTDFTKSGGGRSPPSDSISKGSILGYGKRSIRVAGAINGNENYVSPVFVGAGKAKDFAKMGRRGRRDVSSTESCFQRIWK